MEENKQPIEGGSLLSSLIKALFGGLEKIISDAAEYEEEMGVLKEVSKIPVYPKGNRINEYLLTVKLAPVKDRKNMFYIEAETNAPDLDVSSINKIAIELDKSNQNKFRKVIIDLLNNYGYESDLTEDSPIGQAESEQEGEASDSSEEEKDELTQQIEKLIKEVKSQYDGRLYTSSDAEGNGIEFEVLIDKGSELDLIQMQIEGHGVAPFEADIDALDENGDVRDHMKVIKEIMEKIEDYRKENNYTTPHTQYVRSTTVKASLIREKGSNDVNLTAINASTNIKAAMDIIYDLVEDDDFVDQLPEGEEQSFEITDDGDSYSIEQIDSFDTSDTYLNIFKEVCIADSILKTYRWAVGDRVWNADTSFYASQWPVANLLDRCAVWVVDKTDKFPTVIGAFGNDVTDLDDVKIDGELSLDLVKEQIKLLLQGLAETLDIYYVNIEHNEQKMIDDFLNEVQNILAYA